LLTITVISIKAITSSYFLVIPSAKSSQLETSIFHPCSSKISHFSLAWCPNTHFNCEHPMINWWMRFLPLSMSTLQDSRQTAEKQERKCWTGNDEKLLCKAKSARLGVNWTVWCEKFMSFIFIIFYLCEFYVYCHY
jgi:hypothetical protein